MRLTLVLLMTLALAFPEARAGSELLNPELDRQISAARIEADIVIDGELDEPEWQRAEPVSDFTQQEPFIGEPVSERTEVRLLYDDDNLYVGVYCFDSAGEKGLVVNDVRRDFPPFENDVFGVLLDTFDDNRRREGPGGQRCPKGFSSLRERCFRPAMGLCSAPIPREPSEMVRWVETEPPIISTGMSAGT